MFLKIHQEAQKKLSPIIHVIIQSSGAKFATKYKKFNKV